jgi:hypothetical protein
LQISKLLDMRCFQVLTHITTLYHLSTKQRLPSKRSTPTSQLYLLL